MPLRVLFFGMTGLFSRAPLQQLIANSFDVCAIVVPRPAQSHPAIEPIRLLPAPRAPVSDVPIVSEPREMDIIRIAWNKSISVFDVDRLNDERVLATLKQLQPDVICVACFPVLLPQSLISDYPAFNLHPSLLPAYRGPAPLFWIFHDGLEHAGVTVHLMDSHADTGDNVAQERVALPDGMRYDDVERVCSEHAARLLVRVLHALQNRALARTPQPQLAAPRAPNPTERDYITTPKWTARRAFNFVRGVGKENAVRLEIGTRRFIVHEAVAYEENETQGEAVKREGDFWKIQFAKGTLLCSLRPFD